MAGRQASILPRSGREDSRRLIRIDDGPRDQCGVIGLMLEPEQSASRPIVDGLRALQHRGQSSTGVTTLQMAKTESGIVLDAALHTRILKGLAHRFYGATTIPDEGNGGRNGHRYNLLDEVLVGSAGIGHVRYCTAGSAEVVDAQPVARRINDAFEMSFSFNGNVANMIEIKERLAPDHEFRGNGDGEVLAVILASELRRHGNLEKAFAALQNQVDGAYSIVVITTRGELAAFRDQYGFRPLNLGRSEDGHYMFASETVALDKLGYGYTRPVKPGEMVLVTDDGKSIASWHIGEQKQPKFCQFEPVYFSMPNSDFEGVRISDVRFRLGEELARAHFSWLIDAPPEVKTSYVIIPVPETSRNAASGMSNVLGILVREGLLKNRYPKRGEDRNFIKQPGAERTNGASEKFSPDAAVIAGKNLILVEDSIVRGDTMTGIAEMARRSGAKSVAVCVTEPEIKYPCFYGIDIANRNELIAAKLAGPEAVKKRLGVDDVFFITLEQLRRAIGLGDKICTGCLTGDYPTPKARELSKLMLGPGFTGRYTEVKTEQIRAWASRPRKQRQKPDDSRPSDWRQEKDDGDDRGQTEVLLDEEPAHDAVGVYRHEEVSTR